MNSKDLFEPEVVSETATMAAIENRSKLYCGTCHEEFQHWSIHSCSPYLMKRIEALERIVDRFMCDGK